jgi:hypothetical protein
MRKPVHTTLAASLAASLALLFSMGAVGCGGVGTVRYEGETVKRAGFSRTDVTVYVIDCTDGDTLQCSYQGQPLPWRILGWFRAPPKALGKWERYQERVRERAADVGCRTVGVRRMPPRRGAGEEAIGAVCLDAPDGSAAAPTTAPPAGEKCARDVDCPSGLSCQHGVCK